jgi:hypothetical protein
MRTQKIRQGHLEKLLVSDKSHVKHDKTYLFAKSLFSGLVGLDEKFEFFEVPSSEKNTHLRAI